MSESKSNPGALEQRVGDKAENIFEDWAITGGFHCAKFTPDRVGLDYWFELPSRADARTTTLEREIPGVQGFVQVKGTSTGAAECQIALSVCQRFANSDLPCFILGIVLSDDFRPEGAHLVHIDKDQIARILKRLRKASPEARGRLNRQSLTFRWTAKDALAETTSGAFTDAVHAAVADPSRYASKKSSWRSRCGYEALAYEFKVKPLADADQIVEALLHGQRRISVEVIEAIETRFGIVKPMKFEDGSRFEMEFAPPVPRPAELSTISGTERVAILGELVSSFEPSLISVDAPHVVRFTSPSMTLEIRDDGHRALLSHHGLESPNAPAALAALRAASDVLINLGRVDVRAELAVPELDLSFPIPTPWKSTRYARLAFRSMAFRWAHLVATSAGVPGDLRVDPSLLLDQFDVLRSWAASVDRQTTLYVTATEVVLPPPPFVHLDACWLDLGDRVVFQVLPQRWELVAPSVPEFRIVGLPMKPARVLRNAGLRTADPSSWLRAEIDCYQDGLPLWNPEIDVGELWSAFMAKRAERRGG